MKAFKVFKWVQARLLEGVEAEGGGEGEPLAPFGLALNRFGMAQVSTARRWMMVLWDIYKKICVMVMLLWKFDVLDELLIQLYDGYMMSFRQRVKKLC